MKAARWKSGSVLAATVLVTLIVRDAFATTTTKMTKAATISQVKVVNRIQSDCPFPCSSGPDALLSRSWVNVPGATTTVTVPAHTQALILARFSGAGSCRDNHAGCLFRILIGGVDAFPRGDTVSHASPSTAFGSQGCLDNGTECYVERSRGPVVGGTYTVEVQYRHDTYAGDPYIDGAFDFWNLTAERITA